MFSEKFSEKSLKIFTLHLMQDRSIHAIVYQMYGETGQTDVISLDNKSNNFERGSLDKFTVSAPVVGPLYKIRIWHDDTSPAAGWHLDKVSLWDFVPCILATNFF